MGLTCWVWLVAIGSTGVANAKMPQIGCDGPSDLGGGMGGDDCNLQADALNKLDGVSGVVCGGRYPYLFLPLYEKCVTVAATLNRLIGQPVKNASNIFCVKGYNFLASPDADANSDDCTKLTALLQGPTCKHGYPSPGPSGGGNCTGACDKGWMGSNCDLPTVCTAATWNTPQCTAVTCPASAPGPYKCAEGAASGTCQPAPWPKNSSCSSCIDLSNCNCTDTTHGATDNYGRGCDSYSPSEGCGPDPEWPNSFEFNAKKMCCVCGGGAGPFKPPRWRPHVA